MKRGQLAEPGHRHRGVGQLELHGLEGGDRLAELDAAVHVLDGELHGPVGGAEHLPRREGEVQLEVVGRGGRARRRPSRSVTNGPEAGAEPIAGRAWRCRRAPSSGATRHSANRSPWSTRQRPSGTTANGRPSSSRSSTDGTG